MINILIINLKYSQGGAGIIANQLFNSLKDKFSVNFLYGYGKGAKEDSNATLDNVKMIGEKKQIIANHLSYKTLGVDAFTANSKLVREEIKKADLIHLHAIHSHFINLEFLVKCIVKYNKKVIWTFHDSWAFTGRCALPYSCKGYLSKCERCEITTNYPKVLINNNKRIYKKKQQTLSSIPKDNLVIVCPSQWLAEEARKTFLNKFKIVTINNGIPLDKFKFKETRFKKGEKLKILFVSNYINDPIKGSHYLYKLVDKFPKVEFNAIGHIPKDCFKSSNLNYHGYISSRHSLIEHLQKNHLMVFFSKYDNYPTVILESLAVGTPVVTFKGKGNNEIFKNTNYPFIVNDDDLEKICSTITNILEENKIQLSVISQKGRELIERYNSLDKMIEEYISLFESTLFSSLSSN